MWAVPRKLEPNQLRYFVFFYYYYIFLTPYRYKNNILMIKLDLNIHDVYKNKEILGIVKSVMIMVTSF